MWVREGWGRVRAGIVRYDMVRGGVGGVVSVAMGCYEVGRVIVV